MGKVPHDVLVEVMRAPDLDKVAALLLAQPHLLPDVAMPAHAGGQPLVLAQQLYCLAILAAV